MGLKKMNYKELQKYYLCGIGSYSDIKDFKVGIYDDKRESFSFSNGSYSNMELYKEPRESSATYVISAISLQEIDKVWETINLHLGEKFGVEVPPIPSQEQTESYIKSLTE